MGLTGIGFQIEEFLGREIGPKQVFLVFADKGLGRGNEIDVIDRGVFVEKFGAPSGRVRAEVERG